MDSKQRRLMISIESVAIAVLLSGAAILYAPGAEAVGTPTMSLTAPPSFGGSSLLGSGASASLTSPASGAASAGGTAAASGGSAAASAGGAGATAAGGAGASVGVSAAKAASGMIPFGGTVVQVYPCTNGGWWMTIKPAGLSPVAQVWSPGTVTFLNGPVFHPGQSVLGLDIGPGGCFVGKFFFTGMMMAMVGSSL